MKILPETPSVDFLRKQAKDLLAAMRESHPDVSLTQAQRALAERYGFESWAELKAEVERRRATAAEVDPNLGPALAEAFGLGRPTGPLEQLAWSQTGEQWSLTTESGRWALRTILDWITPESLERSLTLRQAASEGGVSAPEAVRSPDGELVVELDGKHWCADRWIDTGPAPTLPVSAGVAASVGRTLGTLHAIAPATDGEVTPWLTCRRTPDQWNQILGVVRSKGPEWLPALEAAVPAILELDEICDDDPGETLVLCICDLSPSSVRTANGDGIVVVHWDFSGPFRRSMELGSVLSGWGLDHDGNVNRNAVRALLDAYRDSSGREPAADLSMFTADVAAWLNWTVGRIAGALDEEDPERQRREVLELRGLLKNPRTRTHYEALLEAATDPAQVG